MLRETPKNMNMKVLKCVLKYKGCAIAKSIRNITSTLSAVLKPSKNLSKRAPTPLSMKDNSFHGFPGFL